jgi:uncharacterized RDD family membrane protein YckC
VAVAAPPIFGDSAATAVASPPERPIASFWRRLGAFLLDTIILGIAAFVLCIPFFSPLSRLGPYGRLVGIFLALPYYAILNSKVGDGQTLGKRVLDIQVVDARGRTISFGTSVLRYLVLYVPYFLSDASMPTTRTPWLISGAMQVLGVISAATIYLLIFNRSTRQGIHDLAAGTYVVAADLLAAPSRKLFWKPHWLIFTSLVIAAYAGGWVTERKIMKWAPIPQMFEDVRLLEQMQGVQSAAAVDQISSTRGQEPSKRSLVLTIHWVGESSSASGFADQVATAILAHDPNSRDYDALRVVIVRGYDIGIAKSNVNYTFEHSPSHWLPQ